MSNDLVTLFGNSPLVTAGLEDLDADTLAVAGGGARANKRISIKGGVFRKFVGGKEVSALEDRHMNIIFVKMAHKASRTYYEGAYKEGQKISPACWSSDSEKPDAEVKSPCAPTCGECPKAVKGSGQSGTSSACRLSWRTAVVLPSDPAGDVMQLVLPATSAFGKEDSGKFPFRAYIQHLASHNVSAGRVVTRMAFDTKSPTPKLVFSPHGKVPDEDLPIIAAQAKSPAAEQAIKMTVYQTDGGSEDTTEVEPFAERVDEAVSEPVKRESAKAEPSEERDISDIVRKWSRNK
jgi:hypothetical protein